MAKFRSPIKRDRFLTSPNPKLPRQIKTLWHELDRTRHRINVLSDPSHPRSRLSNRAEELRDAFASRKKIIASLVAYYGDQEDPVRSSSGPPKMLGIPEWALTSITEDVSAEFERPTIHELLPESTIVESLVTTPLVAFDSPPAILIPDLTEITDRLIRTLAQSPSLLKDLDPRMFERVLENVFTSMGFVTTLGPGTGDGGIDLRLTTHSDVGPFLVLVQAKRWRERPVTLEYVTSLYALVDSEKANKGVLATTSRFLPGARTWARGVGHRLLLAEPDDIGRWLRKALRSKGVP